MGNNIKITTATAEYTFENILGHQIGGAGAVQIMKRDGDTVVIGNFEEVTVTLDEESKAKFAADLYKAEHPPELPKALKAPVAANEGVEKKDNVVALPTKDTSENDCDVDVPYEKEVATNDTSNVEKGDAGGDKEPDDLLA